MKLLSHVQLFVILWTAASQALPYMEILTIKKYIRDFLGDQVVKNLPSNAGDMCSIPVGRTSIPHAAGQLSLHTKTTEPMTTYQNQREAHRPQGTPHMPQGTPHMPQGTPHRPQLRPDLKISIFLNKKKVK